MTQLQNIKKGNTFVYYAQWENALIGELKSQVRNSLGVLVSEVKIEEMGTPFIFRLIVEDTSNWPIGTLYTDIKRTFDGVSTSSQTMKITIEKGVTE
jgi:hypothetical protein